LDEKFFKNITNFKTLAYKERDIILNKLSPAQEKAYLQIKENFKNSTIIPFSLGTP
jgi:hypothetical protein